MEELLSIRDVSRLLKIKESTLRAWIFQKRIPCIRLGRLVRFRKPELERWLEENIGG